MSLWMSAWLWTQTTNVSVICGQECVHELDQVRVSETLWDCRLFLSSTVLAHINRKIAFDKFGFSTTLRWFLSGKRALLLKARSTFNAQREMAPAKVVKFKFIFFYFNAAVNLTSILRYLSNETEERRSNQPKNYRKTVFIIYVF